jgi:hypothetical protein
VARKKLAALLVLVVSVATALCAASSALAWTVEVTAVPKLKRTYSWKIEKSVDQRRSRSRPARRRT